MGEADDICWPEPGLVLAHCGSKAWFGVVNSSLSVLYALQGQGLHSQRLGRWGGTCPARMGYSADGGWAWARQYCRGQYYFIHPAP